MTYLEIHHNFQIQISLEASYFLESIGKKQHVISWKQLADILNEGLENPD